MCGGSMGQGWQGGNNTGNVIADSFIRTKSMKRRLLSCRTIIEQSAISLLLKMVLHVNAMINLMADLHYTLGLCDAPLLRANLNLKEYSKQNIWYQL